MPSPSELLLGRMAVRNRLISEEQLQHCLAVQEERNKEGLRMALGVIFIEQGFLDQEQLEELILHQSYSDARKEDTLFAKIAVSNRFVRQEDGDWALAEQEHRFTASRELVRVPELLVESGFITLKQAQAVKKAQTQVQTIRKERTIAKPKPPSQEGTTQSVQGGTAVRPGSGSSTARTQTSISAPGLKSAVFREDFDRLVRAAEEVVKPAPGKPAAPGKTMGPGRSSPSTRVTARRPADAPADTAATAGTARVPAGTAPGEPAEEAEGDTGKIELPNCRISTESHTLGDKFEQSEIRIVTVEGSLDAHTFPYFERVISDIVEAGVNRIVVDLKGLEYISSSGLGVVIDKTKACRERSGDLRLANVPEKIKHVLDILGYASLIRQYNAVKGAVLSFQYL